jgi:cellulose synthase/poly-beta-1,6-N-acetylglucosamine synthase-like glycosyltransferase
MLMTCIFFAAAVLFAIGMLATLWHLRWLRRLPPLDSSTPDKAAGWQAKVHCSIVVAARDEEARIEQTVRRLLAQQGVELDLIVIDDRSTDRTGEILAQLAKEDSRLRVVRINTLPEGWLGKCHACHVGASAAKGEWILFTDADCWLKPDVLLRAIRVAELECADHVTLTPGRTTPNLGVRASALLFHISCANLISGVNRDRPDSYLGLGAFNLVRASAYRQCGGYEALRLTVLDDVKLGLLLRRAGKRTRAFLGADDVQAQWGTNAFSTIKLMEKNYFAALDYRLPLALGVGAFLTLLVGGAVLGAVSGTGAGLAAALSPFGLAVPAAILARRLAWSWTVALGVPFVVPVFLYAMLNSTAKTLWRGGIRWRDTFYPLKTLRAGNVR